MIYVYEIIRQLIIISIIVFIVNGAFTNKHIFIRGIAVSVTSFILFALGLISFIVDFNSDNENTFINIVINNIGSLSFTIFSLGYLIFGITLIFKKNKFAKNIKKKMIYTYHEKEEYIYVLFKNNDHIFLTENDNSIYKVKMKKSEFADDLLIKITQKYSLDIISGTDRLGIITEKGEKKDNVYYCYILDINNQMIEKFIKFDVSRISSLDVSRIDKLIIIKLLMGKEFDEII